MLTFYNKDKPTPIEEALYYVIHGNYYNFSAVAIQEL